MINARLWSCSATTTCQRCTIGCWPACPPDEMALTLRWLVTALSVLELTGLWGHARRHPAPVFVAMFDIAREHMQSERLARLAGALGLWPLADPGRRFTLRSPGPQSAE